MYSMISEMGLDVDKVARASRAAGQLFNWIIFWTKAGVAKIKINQIEKEIIVEE